MERMLLKSRLVALGLLASLVVLTGCADRTALLVRVDSTDLAVLADVDRLEINVRGDATGASIDRDFDIVDGWPHSLSLRPGAMEAGGVRVTVTARRAGIFVTRRVVRAAFARGEDRVVEILLSRSCLGVECALGVDCQAGVCDAAPSDAGAFDAMRSDTNLDAGQACRAGEIECAGRCADPLSDEAHCGATGACVGGAVCMPGQRCVSGVCALTCPAGQLPCGGRCIDPSSDTTYCGAGADCVGGMCEVGNVCVGGNCATSCPGGQIACGGRCIDPLADPLLCGTSEACVGGVACAGGTACVAGSCAASCPGMQVVCGGRCVDTASDRNFCGAARDCSGGTTCVSGQVCSGGLCTTSCPGGQIACGGRCIDAATDRNFCGARADCTGGAVCVTGQVCSSGRCSTSCPPGQIACAGRCIDPSTDRTYCGASGMCIGGAACSDSQLCTGGRCVCVFPFVNCGGNCVDTRFEPEHCGRCGSPCARTSACVSGRCVALATGNFTGAFGADWVTVSSSDMRNLEVYIPASQPFLYASRGSLFQAYDIASERWSGRADAPTGLGTDGSMTLLDGRIWQVTPGEAVGYEIATRTWSQFRVRELAERGMTVSADVYLWSAYSGGVQRIHPVTRDVVEFPSSVRLFAPRVASDPTTSSLYVASLRGRAMFRFDLGRTRFEEHPEMPVRIGLAMCSDQDGHLYISNSEDSSDLWQLEIATARWTQLPRIRPIAEVGDEAVGCAISEAGYLFLKSRTGMYRLDLEVL